MIAAGGHVVMLHVEVAAQVGRLEAMLLAQIDYWLERTNNFAYGHFWVYNTMAEWGRQLGVSESAVKRAALHLEEMGLIKRCRRNKAPYDRTLSYTICYQKLREMGFAAQRRSEAMRAAEDPWDKPWTADAANGADF